MQIVLHDYIGNQNSV